MFFGSVVVEPGEGDAACGRQIDVTACGRDGVDLVVKTRLGSPDLVQVVLQIRRREHAQAMYDALSEYLARTAPPDVDPLVEKREAEALAIEAERRRLEDGE